MTELFNILTNRTGSYSLPWLIKLCDEDENIILRYVNDKADIEYLGDTYKATALEYKPNPEALGFDGGGTLSIYCGSDEYVIDLIETYRKIQCEVVGALYQGTVSPVSVFFHTNGNVMWDGKRADFTFEKDERLAMTFPAIVHSHYICRGI